jgi:hypothetical protein
VILSQTKLLKGGACSNLNLCGNDINTSDLFGNGMLNLDTWVDPARALALAREIMLAYVLDEVVAVLLINQEFSSTRIPVLDALCQPNSVGKNGITGLDWEVLGRSNLNDLLVTTLHTAVTLVQMDDIAQVITQELYLNVLGLVEEALNEDGAVAESRLGF